jgi:hypothetical protein
VGRAAAAAWRFSHGVPVLRRGAHRRAPEDALARHRRAGRAGPARCTVPRTVRRGSRRPQPRLPCDRLSAESR